MEEKVIKIAELVKERDFLLRKVGDIEDTKEWTKITVQGEDGAESESSFSFGGTGDNDKENTALAREVHGIIRKNFETRLEVVNEKIAKLLK